MSKFSVQADVRGGATEVPLHGDFKHIKGFTIVQFDGQGEYEAKNNGVEAVVLILEGSCEVTIDGKGYGSLGARASVFSGLPTAVYVPSGSQFSIKGSNAKLAVCRAACTVKKTPAVITPDKVKVIDVGRDNWKREVRLIMGPDGPSENLILGETLNPPGNWSGVPPAKHENNTPPTESLHEELYYFKVDRPQGWGIERLYSQDGSLNELMFLKENTVTFMPRGYHEIVAAPGYTLYYLFFLAGEGKGLIQCEDPDHNWIKNP